MSEWLGGLAAHTALSVYWAMIGLCLLFLAYRVVDKITPGCLNKQLVPADGSAPNVALAVVAGSMLVGISIIIAVAIN